MKGHQVMIRLDESLLAFVNIQAEKSRLTRSEWIRQQLWAVHDDAKKKGSKP